jgi:glycosyltransferase involved in cell wall biosynthesis
MMSDESCPLVSVHMITYNHAPYIAKAIEGILQQKTDFPIELVIGEDCSTDGTREIVFDFQRRYPDIVRVITSETNVGMMPNGLRTDRACRGRYVAYCEGDDYWPHPEKLRKQVAFLEAHSDYGLVHSDVELFDVSTRVAFPSYRSIGPSLDGTHDGGNDLYLAILDERYILWTCSVCVRRSLIDQVIQANPDECQTGRFLMGDIPRWLELSRITRFHRIEESLAIHNFLPESASRSNDFAKRLRFCRAARDMCMHFLHKYDCPTETRMHVIAKHNNAVLAGACWAMDPDAAKDALTELKRAGLPIGVKARLSYLAAHNSMARRILLKGNQLRRRMCGTQRQPA